MNDSGARPKRERGLAEPALQRRAGHFLVDDSGRERLRRERNVVTCADGRPHEINVAAEAAIGDVDQLFKDEATRTGERTVAQIERLMKADRVHEVGRLTEEFSLNVGG